MNLDALRTFLEVIQTRSLVAASRRLHVTQSTVTARLNALEEEIGQKLLHRGKSGAELTSAGFKFERYAQVMVQLWRQARYEVSLGARPELDAAYVYVDHGEEFRRQHAAAFPSETTSALTIASSEWAIDHLLSRGGSGYLSRRHAAAHLGRKLHPVRGAPGFKRRVYLLESPQTVARWPWYEPAVAWAVQAFERA